MESKILNLNLVIQHPNFVPRFLLDGWFLV